MAAFLATFFLTTSYVASFVAAASGASFALAAHVAAAMLPAAELQLDPPGVVAYVAANEAGLGAGAAGGGPPAIDLPRPHSLIHLCSGTSSLDDTLLSLWMTHTTFPFPLLGVGQGAVPPWPPVVPAPGICTPQDWLLLWIGAMPTSSIEGIATSNIDLVA
jgi:hypothetical protein